jgi:hypothetical protein
MRFLVRVEIEVVDWTGYGTSWKESHDDFAGRRERTCCCGRGLASRFQGRDLLIITTKAVRLTGNREMDRGLERSIPWSTATNGLQYAILLDRSSTPTSARVR